MKTLLRAGAVALAIAGIVSNAPATASDYAGYVATRGVTVNIARIKSALRLRPEQEAYWPALEAALRSVGHARRGSVVSVVLDSASIQRVASAARPLVAVLDYGQIQTASMLCDQMGLGPVVAALH
jgi:hypothetical protein